jgi:hypothetical protein
MRNKCLKAITIYIIKNTTTAVVIMNSCSKSILPEHHKITIVFFLQIIF